MFLNNPEQLREQAQSLREQAQKLRDQAAAMETSAEALEQQAKMHEQWLSPAQPFANLMTEAVHQMSSMWSLKK